MKWIIGIIVVYAIYFLVVTIMDLMKKNNKAEAKNDNTIFEVEAESDEPISVIGEVEKKK